MSRISGPSDILGELFRAISGGGRMDQRLSRQERQILEAQGPRESESLPFLPPGSGKASAQRLAAVLGSMAQQTAASLPETGNAIQAIAQGRSPGGSRRVDTFGRVPDPSSRPQSAISAFTPLVQASGIAPDIARYVQEASQEVQDFLNPIMRSARRAAPATVTETDEGRFIQQPPGRQVTGTPTYVRARNLSGGEDRGIVATPVFSPAEPLPFVPEDEVQKEQKRRAKRDGSNYWYNDRGRREIIEDIGVEPPRGPVSLENPFVGGRSSAEISEIQESNRVAQAGAPRFLSPAQAIENELLAEKFLEASSSAQAVTPEGQAAGASKAVFSNELTSLAADASPHFQSMLDKARRDYVKVSEAMSQPGTTALDRQKLQQQFSQRYPQFANNLPVLLSDEALQELKLKQRLTEFNGQIQSQLGIQGTAYGFDKTGKALFYLDPKAQLDAGQKSAENKRKTEAELERDRAKIQGEIAKARDEQNRQFYAGLDQQMDRIASSIDTMRRGLPEFQTVGIVGDLASVAANNAERKRQEEEIKKLESKWQELHNKRFGELNEPPAQRSMQRLESAYLSDPEGMDKPLPEYLQGLGVTNVDLSKTVDWESKLAEQLLKGVYAEGTIIILPGNQAVIVKGGDVEDLPTDIR